MKHYKFITPVSMPCTKEESEEITEKLKTLGYTPVPLKVLWKDNLEGNNICTFDNEFGFSGGNSIAYAKTLKLESYNPQLFLALATMTDNPEGMPGEWWMCLYDLDNFRSGILYKQYTNQSCTGFRNDSGCREDFAILRDKKHSEWWRKPTTKEIMEHFNKETPFVEKFDNPEQLYKLKEEVRKYIESNYYAESGTFEYWENKRIKIEALEPVESRIRIVHQNGGALLKIRHDGEPIDFTEQERKDTQHLINKEYGDIKELLGLVWEYGQHIKNTSTKMMKVGDTFDWWLKEIRMTEKDFGCINHTDLK